MTQRCLTSNNNDDSGSFPVRQVSFDKKVANAEIITPYGFDHNPPLNALGVMLDVNGQAENRAAMITDPLRRKKNLKTGEVSVGNRIAGSEVYFEEDGNVRIVTPKNLVITVAEDGEITISGALTMNVSGITTINSDVVINGSLVVNDAVTVNNSLVVTGEITGDGVSVSNHLHHVGAAPGDTSPPL